MRLSNSLKAPPRSGEARQSEAAAKSRLFQPKPNLTPPHNKSGADISQLRPYQAPKLVYLKSVFSTFAKR